MGKAFRRGLKLFAEGTRVGRASLAPASYNAKTLLQMAATPDSQRYLYEHANTW